ncbi:hypothetical protein [Nocardioides sp. NPDC047086]|uniref:hypothetical protein n=1 Tax=Nocardioides sp. NPDC047086 TaxID=3154810 RepID=UPI0033E97926
MSTIAVLGVGLGLGMSVAQRFAKEGYVGGLIERGDIHRMLTDPGTPTPYATLDPDEIADAVWRLATELEDDDVFDVLTPQPADG